jgi:site-specific recombinase XerD
MNFPKYEQSFIQEMKRLNYSEETIKNYVSCLHTFFIHFEKKEHPLHINESDIKDYLGKFSVTNTQRSQHGAIKKFYSICMNQKEKFKYIPYARKEKKLPIVLSQEEIQKMFSACQNLKHKVILALLYSCGLRVSELINLKWQHIDRSRMVINILQGKGKKDRQVMLSSAIIPLLENYYRQFKSKEYVLNGWKNELQYSDRSVGEVVKQLAEKAGIKKRVWTHLMRHCSFTHMVEAGTDINLVQRLAGHSSVKTTSIYLHTSHNLISKIQSPISAIVL